MIYYLSKIILYITFLITSLQALADEGMWLPILLDQLTIADMQSKGMKLSSEDIYSINHSSMKDAVLLFGSGCTGEVVSEKGLVLTNHHCGFGQIQSHSSIEHNYIKDGFWAMKQENELVCPGLSVTFIIRMEDVTSYALMGVTDGMNELERQKQIEINNKSIEQDAIKGSHYGAYVRSFYSGNQYYLFITETYRDVRLVGAPPQSIGNFGGDEDNWIWPRHAADFSLFRIYANQNNEPAEYSAENVPFKPRYFFPISLKGVKDGDFTMVYGFPGRTTEYISSYAVDVIQNISDPQKVAIRDARLNIWWNDMMANDSIRIKYSAKYYGLSNAWKKWQGEIMGLKKADAIEKKMTYETDFNKRVQSNPQWQENYGNILPSLKMVYDSIRIMQPLIDYYNEALMSPEIFKIAGIMRPLTDKSRIDTTSQESMLKLIEKIRAQCEAFFKDYNARTDMKMTSAMVDLSINNLTSEQLPPLLIQSLHKYDGQYDNYASDFFAKSFLDNEERVISLLNGYKKGREKKLLKDPAFTMAVALKDYYDQSLLPSYLRLNDRLNVLNREYMRAQMEVMKDRRFYPDANSTLRVAYGKVEGYQPRDAVEYNYYTTIDGLVGKYVPHDEFYDAPQRLLQLYEQKDFGAYADASGNLRTCFIASNHTTGGNSGSPVLNGEGQLIGTNFDRCWEGTMSDIYFDSSQCRNITLDVRYTLFIIDKYAGAGYLINEMSIVK
ncbi:MAG: S46 family peptidase [Chitinophagales bacterium]|nr:S46 family peptidase [Chitinophagales bacterium]